MVKYSCKHSLCALLLFCFSLVYSNWLSAKTMRIAVFEEHYNQLQYILDTSGCTLKALEHEPSNHMLAELLILCLSLKQLAPETEFVLQPYPLHKRLLNEIEQGNADVSGMGFWDFEADRKRFIVSIPFVDRGQFTKGLYSSHENVLVTNQMAKMNFSEYRATINTNWPIDTEALQCAGFQIVHADRYDTMYTLVAGGRADVFPHTFTAESDLRLVRQNHVFMPIPNIKITFDYARQYVISKHAKPVELMLNGGIQQLKKQGVIAKINDMVGINREATRDWPAISCH